MRFDFHLHRSIKLRHDHEFILVWKESYSTDVRYVVIERISFDLGWKDLRLIYQTVKFFYKPMKYVHSVQNRHFC